MKEEDKKGTLQIKRWNIKKLDEVNNELLIVLDKENIMKLISGLVPLVEKNDTFYLGFTLNEFGLHFEHTDKGHKHEEPLKN